MQILSILRKKRVIVGLIILALVGIGIYALARPAKAKYDTVAVERRTLARTVEVTGAVRPAARIDLAFKIGGRVEEVNVKVGDEVKRGAVLMALEGDDAYFGVRSAAAALRVAQANLAVRQAGDTTQSLRVSETQVEQARAAYDKALADLASTKVTAQDTVDKADLAVEIARHDLADKTASLSQTVSQAYDSLRASLVSAQGPMQTALYDGDMITGVDNTAANQQYLFALGALDSGSLERAKLSYGTAKQAKLDAEAAVKVLSSSSSFVEINAASTKTQAALSALIAYLSDVQKVLAATITTPNLTAADLAAKKAMIDTDRAAMSTHQSSVLAAVQSVKSADLTQTNTLRQYEDAYKTAVANWNTARANAVAQTSGAEAAAAIQKSAWESAKAALDQKRAAPREVDLAPLRAAVAQAQAAHDKAVNDQAETRILAPVDGTVSEVAFDEGETVMGGAVVVKLIGTSSFDVEASVPEADIAKIAVGQNASITLDAYGDEVKFDGAVTAVDPAEIKIQDAVYYKIRVQIKAAGRELKPGMTANVTVNTAEKSGALVIPLRAVRTRGDLKIVRVLVEGAPVEREIELGLRGDEGRVEVTRGLAEGEQVVVGEDGRK